MRIPHRDVSLWCLLFMHRKCNWGLACLCEHHGRLIR